MKLAVIGAGVAGAAAVWSARRTGADVTVFFDRPGASSLYSGALDRVPWEVPDVDLALPADLLAFAAAFDAWTVGTASARVATYEGVLRPARGRDTALLDLAPLAGKRVVLASTGIDGFPAATLARSLAASGFARRTKMRFDVVTVTGILDASEEGIPAFDVARLHDAPGRVARLAECLRNADGDADAWLLGPWLGTTVGASEALRETLGRPLGETTSPPGGAAGARFDASRDSFFAQLGVAVRRARVSSIVPAADRWRLGTDAGEALDVDAVVLAIGGVAGGGLTIARNGGALCTSLDAPVRLGLDGESLTPAGAGSDWVALGLGALERVGVLTEGLMATGVPRIFVAGDAVAGRARTTLDAARSGIDAAALAARGA